MFEETSYAECSPVALKIGLFELLSHPAPIEMSWFEIHWLVIHLGTKNAWCSNTHPEGAIKNIIDQVHCPISRWGDDKWVDEMQRTYSSHIVVPLPAAFPRLLPLPGLMVPVP